jgi:Dna[CI] antecedent DciA-like protein
MSPSNWRAQEAELRRLTTIKQTRSDFAAPLGPEMVNFFQNSVQKKQTKMSKLAACWFQLVPETLSDHCSLESLSRGTLVVLVDSASHLYELKQLLLAGLQQQLILACKFAGLKKITLKPGRTDPGPDASNLPARSRHLQDQRDQV